MPRIFKAMFNAARELLLRKYSLAGIKYDW